MNDAERQTLMTYAQLLREMLARPSVPAEVMGFRDQWRGELLSDARRAESLAEMLVERDCTMGDVLEQVRAGEHVARVLW